MHPGQGRRTTKEFLYHLSVARGSLLEVQTQIEIARRLTYLPVETAEAINQLLTTVVRLLNGLMNALDRKLANEKV
jgi:four helix bundle protein